MWKKKEEKMKDPRIIKEKDEDETWSFENVEPDEKYNKYCEEEKKNAQ